MKKATLVSRAVVSPKFEHDCENCTFLGSLDGEDLYACVTERGVEYSRRFGNEGPQYGSLGSITPEGSPYAFAQALLARRNCVGASFARFKQPRAWKTVGGAAGLVPEPVTARQMVSALGGRTRTVRGPWPLS